VTAFASVFGVDIEAGEELCLREAADGAAPAGPERMILFKVTDAPTTHEKLTDVGYDVTFGRRLFMDDADPLITDDPDELGERDYYTLAYAVRSDADQIADDSPFSELA
jgi:precorrin-2/cobalt-factor-2 C20-methyltransferase